MMEWQPIETAPKTGRVVVALPVYGAHTKAFLHWDAWSADMDSDHEDEDIYSGWRIADATHWMPLPCPPKVVVTQGERSG